MVNPFNQHRILAMNKLTALFATTLLVASFASLAEASTFNLPDKTPFFSITFPDTWAQKDKDNTGYLEMGTPDDAIWIDIWVLENAKSPEDTNTISDITDDMKSWLTDIDVKRAPDGDCVLGGLQFTSYQGTGKTKDGDLQIIEADICSPDGKNQVVVCYYGNKGASIQYKDDLQTIFGSIKKL
jgi:hypothetical protein